MANSEDRGRPRTDDHGHCLLEEEGRVDKRNGKKESEVDKRERERKNCEERERARLKKRERHESAVT